MPGLQPTGFDKKIFSDIRASIVTAVRAIPGMSRVNLGDDSVLGSVVSGVSRAMAEAWDVLAEAYASFDRDSASGRSLDNLAGIVGLYRREAKPTRVTCTVTLAVGTYAAGVLLASKPGEPSVLYENESEIVVTTGGVQTGKVFVCQETGARPVPTGSLTVISSPYTGWSAITNPADGVLGRDVETDAELRQRMIEGTPRGALASDSRIKKVFIYENNTDAWVGALPPHSFNAVVWDGTNDGSAVSDAEIAALLYQDTQAGIETVGDISETVTDTVGLPHTINFDRPTLVPVYLEVEVETNADWDGANGPDLVKEALVAWAQERLTCGTDVRHTALFGTVYGIPGVENVPEIYLDTAASPSPNVADLVIAAHEIAEFDTSRIIVTLV